MLDKAIEAKFKTTFQFFISIYKMDACYWKSQKPNKRDKTFKPPKKKNKTTLADSQLIALLDI